MRHDPASAAIVIMLRSLKMYGMAQAVSDLMEQGSPAFEAAVPIISQLLKAETAEREVRSIAYQIKAARFPAYKDLTGFDFASSEVNEASGATTPSLRVHRQSRQCRPRRRPRNRKDASGDGPRRSSRRTSPQKGSLLLDRRTGQCAREGESPGKNRPDHRAPRPKRSRDPGRVWLFAVQRVRRSFALPPAQQAL